MNYYNENEPFAAQWLRELIKAGMIPDGHVDERSILDVKPEDLAGYNQCHFFAGIGGWSYALSLAGWPIDRPVWTGSCPCQPFSTAGTKQGFKDDRHLWPAFHDLIAQCRPPVVFGEQVASKDGLNWLDHVQVDLEGAGYANAAFDLCAAGIGAPHLRQRLWFVAELVGDTERQQSRRDARTGLEAQGGSPVRPVGDSVEPPSSLGRVAESNSTGPQPGEQRGKTMGYRGSIESAGSDGRMADVIGSGTGPTNGFWRDTDWLFCRDGKWRAVEPGTCPLANGVSNRVGKLRGYGNAIVPQVAKEVIASYMETTAC